MNKEKYTVFEELTGRIRRKIERASFATMSSAKLEIREIFYLKCPDAEIENFLSNRNRTISTCDFTLTIEKI